MIEFAWSNDSRYIVYTYRTAEIVPTFIEVYDTEIDKYIIYNKHPEIEDIEYQEIVLESPRWLPDNSAILVKYGAYEKSTSNNAYSYGKFIRSGEVLIPIDLQDPNTEIIDKSI